MKKKVYLVSLHKFNCLVDSMKYPFPQKTPIRQPNSRDKILMS